MERSGVPRGTWRTSSSEYGAFYKSSHEKQAGASGFVPGQVPITGDKPKCSDVASVSGPRVKLRNYRCEAPFTGGEGSIEVTVDGELVGSVLFSQDKDALTVHTMPPYFDSATAVKADELRRARGLAQAERKTSRGLSDEAKEIIYGEMRRRLQDAVPDLLDLEAALEETLGRHLNYCGPGALPAHASAAGSPALYW